MTIFVHAKTRVSPEQVWAVLSDLPAWPQWLPTMLAVDREVAEAPEAEGASYLVKQPRLRKARWVITDWKPGRGFTWQSTSGGVTTTGTHELRADPESGTEIVLGIAWSGPLAWLARVVYGRMTRRYMEAEAEALVARSEQARRPAP